MNELELYRWGGSDCGLTDPGAGDELRGFITLLITTVDVHHPSSKHYKEKV